MDECEANSRELNSPEHELDPAQPETPRPPSLAEGGTYPNDRQIGAYWWNVSNRARMLRQIFIPGESLLKFLQAIQDGKPVRVEGIPDHIRFLTDTNIGYQRGMVGLLVASLGVIMGTGAEVPATMLYLSTDPDGTVVLSAGTGEDNYKRPIPSAEQIEEVLDTSEREGW